MDKVCRQCGAEMHLTLRKLVYHLHEIENVPVYTCSVCGHHEVSERVKPELRKVIHTLEAANPQQKVAFQDFSEFSNLLVLVADETEEGMIEEKVEERINQLLDLLVLAKSLNDQKWVEEISSRLKQVM